MAEKGIKGAYKQVTPRAIDYGKISEDIAGRFVAQQDQRRKEKAAELLRKQKQAEADRKRAEQTLKEQAELSKIAQDFLVTKPIMGARTVSSLLSENGKKEYASLIKEYETADYSRRAQIQDKVRQMAGWGKQWNDAVTSINSKLSEVTSKMGQVGGFDQVLSAKWVVDLSRALQSGAQLGAIKRGEKSIDLGQYITIEDVGTGALNVTFRDDQGNELVSGSLQDIVGKLSGQGLVGYVDSDAEFTTNFGKGQLANIVGSSNAYDELIKVSRGTDENGTKARLRSQFDQTYLSQDQNGRYTNLAMEKEIRKGNTIEDIRERAVEAAWSKMRRESTDLLKANPEWKSTRKAEDISRSAKLIGDVIKGKEYAGGNILAGADWEDPRVIISSPQLSSYKVYGNRLVATIENPKGDKEVVSYSIKDEADLSAFTRLAFKASGEDKKNSSVTADDIYRQIKQMNLRGELGSRFLPTGEDAGEDLSQYVKDINLEAIKDAADDAGKDEDGAAFQSIINAADPAIEILEDNGYEVEVSPATTWHGYRFIVKDQSGTEVVRTSSGGLEEYQRRVAGHIKEFISKINVQPQATKDRGNAY